jgi:hypothetical protein
VAGRRQFFAEHSYQRNGNVQAETFDTATISRELKWAASIGMNTMRVFLHDQLHRDNPQGFKKD